MWVVSYRKVSSMPLNNIFCLWIFQRADCLADLLSGNRLCPACCPYPNFLGRISSLILTITLHRVSHEMPKKTFSVWSWTRQVTLAHHFFLNPSSELRNATLKLVLILIHTSQLSLTFNYFLLTSDISSITSTLAILHQTVFSVQIFISALFLTTIFPFCLQFVKAISATPCITSDIDKTILFVLVNSLVQPVRVLSNMFLIEQKKLYNFLSWCLSISDTS